LRQGITQARGSLDQTKARLVAAGKKIDEAGAFMKKGAWEDGRGVLRRSAGTMRFDLRTVATSKSGQGRTEALRKTQQFLSDLDRFDNAMRLKDKPAAEVDFSQNEIFSYSPQYSFCIYALRKRTSVSRRHIRQ